MYLSKLLIKYSSTGNMSYLGGLKVRIVCWRIQAFVYLCSPMTARAFFIKLTLFTLIPTFLLLAAKVVPSSISIPVLAWPSLVYFYLLSFVVGAITHSGLKKDNKTFLTRTYSAIGIRFVFSIFPVLIYLLFSPVRELTFIVIYILLYFFYTSFEIYILVVNLRPDLKK